MLARHACAIALVLLCAAGSGCRAHVPANVAAPPINVMTFNIRFIGAPDGDNGWSYRKDLAAQVIRDVQPDLLGLQEAEFSQVQDLAAALPGYQRVGVGRQDGAEGGEFSAIFYRSAHFTLDASGTFWFSDTPEVPGSLGWGNTVIRICTWGRFIDRQTGRALYHFNTHLDHRSQPSREKSAQLLMKRIAERKVSTDPVVLTGDFNVTDDNPVYQYVVGAGALAGTNNPLPLVDSFTGRLPAAAEAGTFHRFEGKADGRRIDFILVSPGQDILASRIIHTQRGGRYPSDHFPVTARIQLFPLR